MSQRIDKLREAIETTHKCKARHVRSDLVIEFFRGELAWEGIVETFHLDGHPGAECCYAWSFTENGEQKYTTVLEIPPVDSPQSAVKVAIASNARSN